MRDRYSIVVGLLFAAVIAIAFASGIGDENGGGILGLDEKPDGWPLPEFAVPAAAGPEADANVAQDDCETSGLPCPEGSRRTPACRISTPGAIRVCDFFDRPLVLSFWFTKGGDDCVGQQDVVEQAYARYRGRVSFLSLDVRDSRDTVQDIVREHGWTMPVGYDRDGAVASLYRVGLCPTFAYVYPGGTLHKASIGTLTAGQLEARIEALLRATRAAEAS
ncbi:MAG: hypothetical protein WD827_01725 [Solirubrobacterales bacterium]